MEKLNELKENLGKLNKRLLNKRLEEKSKEDKKFSTLWSHYFMYFDSINKFEAILVGILTTLATSLWIFFLQGGNINGLFSWITVIFMAIFDLLILFIILKLNLVRNKKDDTGSQIRRIEKERN